MTVTALIRARIEASIADALGGRSELIPLAIDLASGTGADQVDQSYFSQHTIADSSTPQTLDLRGGTALIGSDRTAFSVVKLATLIIVNLSATQTLTFGPHSSNGLTGLLTGTTPGLVIPPSSNIAAKKYSFIILHCQGGTVWAVGAGTDTIAISTGAGTNVPFLIGLLGRSA